MRAFIAAVPPEHVLADLQDFLLPRQDPRWRQGTGDWRWTRSEQMHLTLAFLPDVPDHLEESLVEAGGSWAGQQRPLPASLGGAGAFPDPSSAKVVWTGVGDEAARAGLRTWAHHIRGWAGHAGVAVAGRSFRPHLTVARVRGHRGVAAGPLVQALDGYASPAWTVDSVALVASRLGQGPGGTPRYDVLHEWGIAAADGEAGADDQGPGKVTY